MTLGSGLLVDGRGGLESDGIHEIISPAGRGGSTRGVIRTLTTPSCFDGIRNQDEIGIDCGGVCGQCPACDDEIQNQNEEGIDCGGPCSPCSTVDVTTTTQTTTTTTRATTTLEETASTTLPAAPSGEEADYMAISAVVVVAFALTILSYYSYTRRRGR
jgi:hypothetical protein